jgi:SAM-dependent methyltransferase
MAIPLLNYLGPTSSYIGFDIAEKAIEWCQSHITPRNPQFQFVCADIRNGEYNRRGKTAAVDYQFPCGSASIDFAFATSVFTHMRLPEVRHYLEEVRRCLKPSGRAMLTFFIMDETNRRLVREGKASADFSTAMEDFYTIDPRAPERAIAYSEEALVALIADVGLNMRLPIFYGSWSGRQGMLSAQDVVLVTKDKP